MLTTANGVKGVVLRGIDPESGPRVLSMLRQMRSGSAADLQKEGAPGLIIGEELAKRLGLAVGSRVNLLYPVRAEDRIGLRAAHPPLRGGGRLQDRHV